MPSLEHTAQGGPSPGLNDLTNLLAMDRLALCVGPRHQSSLQHFGPRLGCPGSHQVSTSCLHVLWRAAADHVAATPMMNFGASAVVLRTCFRRSNHMNRLQCSWNLMYGTDSSADRDKSQMRHMDPVKACAIARGVNDIGTKQCVPECVHARQRIHCAQLSSFC